MIGQTLGSFKITHKIGAGGQGTVYKATDTKLGRAVVIKVLPPELTGKDTNLKRFDREARLASSLDHGSMCTSCDRGGQDGMQYSGRQQVEGRNGGQVVKGRPL